MATFFLYRGQGTKILYWTEIVGSWTTRACSICETNRLTFDLGDGEDDEEAATPKPTKKNTRNRRAQDLSFSFSLSLYLGLKIFLMRHCLLFFMGTGEEFISDFQIWKNEEGLRAEEWIIRTPMQIRATQREQGGLFLFFYFALISYNICHNYTYLSHIYYIFIITPGLHIIIYFWHIFIYLF